MDQHHVEAVKVGAGASATCSPGREQRPAIVKNEGEDQSDRTISWISFIIRPSDAQISPSDDLLQHSIAVHNMAADLILIVDMVKPVAPLPEPDADVEDRENSMNAANVRGPPAFTIEDLRRPIAEELKAPPSLLLFVPFGVPGAVSYRADDDLSGVKEVQAVVCCRRSKYLEQGRKNLAGDGVVQGKLEDCFRRISLEDLMRPEQPESDDDDWDDDDDDDDGDHEDEGGDDEREPVISFLSSGAHTVSQGGEAPKFLGQSIYR